MRTSVLLLLLLTAPPALSRPTAETSPTATPREGRPNIVFILADDLGYGDLGCYGQKVIQTPHLDRMAAEGMRFTDFYAGSTVCAPSRSCLMTGLHTGHTYMRGNGKDLWLRPDPQDRTVARILKDAGYATAMIGKSSTSCGIPADLAQPNKKGFDHFFGVLSHWEAHHYYPEIVYRNGETIPLEGNTLHEGRHYVHDLYLQEARQWLTANKDCPFFLLYSAHIPHASLAVNEEWIARYRGKVGRERDERGNYHYRDTSEPKATFAGMVSRLDWEVGELLAHLKGLGLDDNTIVLFASDNGAMNEGGHLEADFNSSGPLRGTKRDTYDGGIRTPFIVRWPGKVQAGAVSGHVGAFWDFLPTACEIAGAEPPPDTDGVSFLPALLGGEPDTPADRYLYWEFHERGGRRALRMGDYKAVQYDVNKNPHGPIEIYDIRKDPGETRNIAGSTAVAVSRARALFKSARTESPGAGFNFPAKPEPAKKE